MILKLMTDILPSDIDYLRRVDLANKLRIKRSKKNMVIQEFTDKKYNINGFKVKIDELSHYRDLMGLPALKLKVRQCLRCSNKFHSVSNGNRMCDECK